jgi:NAD(P)H-hydrate epimerase
MLFSESSALHLAEQVAELDHLVMQHQGISASILMKRAGRVAFELLSERWPNTTALHIFCGAGNNAGDGYIVAALALQRQLTVHVWYLCDPQTLQGAAQQAYEYAVREGAVCQAFNTAEFMDMQLMQPEETVLVDALLGTGVDGPLREPYREAVNAINAAKDTKAWPIIAMDIPTGVNPNTGAVSSSAIMADATMSFIGQKQGLFTGAGRVHSGERCFSTLEVDDEWLHLVNPNTRIIDSNKALALLPERSLDAHKGNCGHVLIVGGDVGASYGYGGAPIMAAQMALRSGAGLVSVAAQPTFVSAVLARQPEMMAAGIENGQALLPLLEKASGIVIGTGLGQSPWSEQLLYQALQVVDKPMVIDADALHLLAQTRFSSLVSQVPEQRQWILTPHPGEAAALLGVSIDAIQADRFSAAQRIQQQYGGAVILKGAGTIVVTSTGAQWLCDAGSAAMASGGMGDVLSGLLGALLVQGMTTDQAALLGTVLHSLAADVAVAEHGQRGLLATDLIPYVQGLLDDGSFVNR